MYCLRSLRCVDTRMFIVFYSPSHAWRCASMTSSQCRCDSMTLFVTVISVMLWHHHTMTVHGVQWCHDTITSPLCHHDIRGLFIWCHDLTVFKCCGVILNDMTSYCHGNIDGIFFFLLLFQGSRGDRGAQGAAGAPGHKVRKTHKLKNLNPGSERREPSCKLWDLRKLAAHLRN